MAIAHQFDYVKPASLAAAVKLLAQTRRDGAGGRHRPDQPDRRGHR